MKRLNIGLIGTAGLFLFLGIYFVNSTASMRVSISSSRAEVNDKQHELSIRDQEKNSAQAIIQLRSFAESSGLVVAKEQNALFTDSGVAFNDPFRTQN